MAAAKVRRALACLLALARPETAARWRASEKFQRRVAHTATAARARHRAVVADLGGHGQAHGIPAQCRLVQRRQGEVGRPSPAGEQLAVGLVDCRGGPS